MIKQLILAGANVNAVDDLGRRPLHIAAQSADAETIRTLIANGARPDAEDRNGKVPIEFAIEANRPQAILQLLGSNDSTLMAEVRLRSERQIHRDEIYLLSLGASRNGEYFNAKRLGYTCDSLVRGFPDRYDDLDNPSNARYNWAKAYDIANRFNACVHAFTEGKSRPSIESMVPVFPLLNVKERQDVMLGYEKGMASVQQLISQSQRQIADELSQVQESQGRMQGAAEAARRAAADNRKWLQDLSADLARLPAQMKQDMARTESMLRGSTLEQDQAKARRAAAFDAVIAKMEADPNSELNQNKRTMERQRAEARKAEADRIAARDANKRVKLAEEGRLKSEMQAQQVADAAAAKQRTADAETARLAAEKKRQADDQHRRDIVDEVDRKQAAERAAAAAKAKEEQAKRDEQDRATKYLSTMRNSIKLAALSCPDGKGAHYIVGLRPRVKPEPVSCLDVYYTETCPGAREGSSGVIKGFLGASTDCFLGDASPVSPTPSCKPHEAHVVVDRVESCK